ncbi:polysaccharide biosynthesis/export family protein [Asticcacaulis benevestitus]|uniref:Uncharacterized protein n=1 Tax=Asticcacaulis benevestitus DSM 16100 = ATCC BAA-896 TaxID=1121022 RepID=V4RDG7_9CAUL|nr:polysaccharide biosynthesis/export family protein [Asticcacaulis benevestitus]ESQ89453.1 hypothetical protein ABENE_13825 [Asticcacaulis benevestitus DSM 16100 = ATCC BAA-896]
MSRRVKNTLILALMMATASAAVAPAVFAQASTDAPAMSASAPVLSPQGNEYRLGSADKVRVIVFGETDLSGEFAVSGDGKVALPLIGEIPAVGATASELQSRIAKALADGYLQNPKVSVEVLSYRPFYILGEVNKPGEYPYSSGMTVERAVATASGYTYRANHKKVYIKRANATDEVQLPLDSKLVIEPGDTIRIVERYF